MNPTNLGRAAALSAIAAMLCAACGSESGASGESQLGGGPGDDAGQDARGGDPGGNDDGGPGNGDAGGTCGTATTAAPRAAASSVRPLNIVVMFDKSASLGGDNTQTRWEPVRAAMERFFADSKSAGIRAGLHYFPLLAGSASNCQSKAYTTPAVQQTALPSQVFGTSLENQTPGGGSPMFPAIQGALDTAKKIATERPQEKTMILLVTDGDPKDCQSTYDNVRSVIVEAKNSAIPTVVVSVGPEAPKLDALAAAGGTQKSIVAAVGDPAKTAAELQTRVNDLRQAAVSCSLQLKPPAGKTIDRNSVTVTMTPASGQPTALPYSEQCTGQVGWHFSNAAEPATVTLCAGSCNQLNTDKGSLRATFACTP